MKPIVIKQAFSENECDSLRDLLKVPEVKFSRTQDLENNRYIHERIPQECFRFYKFGDDIIDHWMSKVKKFLKENELWTDTMYLGNMHTCLYAKDDFISEHIDNGVNTEREYTAVVMLSRPEDFDGGTLVMCDTRYDLSIGDMIVLQSGTPHEVELVKSGKRYTAVLWWSVER